MKDTLEKIKTLLSIDNKESKEVKMYAEMILDDGRVLATEDDQFMIGSKVMVIGDDGETSPLEAGSYTMQDGAKITIDEDSKILDMGEEKEAEEVENEEEKEEMEEEKKDEEMEEMSKKDLMAAMHKKMEGMDKKDLMAAYGSMNMGMHEETDDNIEERISDINVKEDVSALISGEDLSEEFKIKAATIFEAAVKSKIRSEVERMEESYAVQLEEATEVVKEELSEKVDGYLSYVVEEWMRENEIAVERGLKGEIAEDFISGLKQLFEDHYIDVPDEKYDILEAQSEKISELEEKLNSSIQENIERKKVVESLTRDAVMHEMSEELTVTEMEKFKSLTEELEFVSEESFRQKLDTLKEGYFPKTGGEETFAIVDGDSEEPAQDIDTTDTIKSYLSAISRTK